MKSLVIFDSFFHNTEAIARQVADGLGARAVQFEDASLADLQGLDLLVVGSPTQRFGPTDELVRFLEALPAGSLKGTRVAAFDTRMDTNVIRNWLFRVIVKLGGFAAPKLQARLAKAGAVPAFGSNGFWVTGQEGPLKDGELERARQWGASMLAGEGSQRS